MNYYVMNKNGQMIHRDTLDGCRAWIKNQFGLWRSQGMNPPQMRIFYQSAAEHYEIYEPTHQFKAAQSDNCFRCGRAVSISRIVCEECETEYAQP